MLQLTDDQKQFLEHHQLSSRLIFDATGMNKKEYKPLMKESDKFIAIGVTPCKAKGHTMRTRDGHCIQCSRAALTFIFRHYSNSNVYVFASQKKNIIKVGFTKDPKKRINDFKNYKFAGTDDWKTLYNAKWKNAGKIEKEIHKQLEKYYSKIEYYHNGKNQASYEVFKCSYNKIKKIINNIKKELPNELFENEYFFSDINNLYNFENIESSDIRKGNILENSVVPSNTNTFTRKSEFSEDSNQIRSYSTTEIEQFNSIKNVSISKNFEKNKNKLETNQSKNEIVTNTQKPIEQNEINSEKPIYNSKINNHLNQENKINENKTQIKITKKGKLNYYIVLYVISVVLILYFLLK